MFFYQATAVSIHNTKKFSSLRLKSKRIQLKKRLMSLGGRCVLAENVFFLISFRPSLDQMPCLPNSLQKIFDLLKRGQPGSIFQKKLKIFPQFLFASLTKSEHFKNFKTKIIFEFLLKLKLFTSIFCSQRGVGRLYFRSSQA